MILATYGMFVLLAGVLSALGWIVPALIVAGVAAGIVFRREIARWLHDLHATEPRLGR